MIKTCGPWQMAATGFPAAIAPGDEIDHRVAHAHAVRRVAAGNDQRIELFHTRGAGGE